MTDIKPEDLRITYTTAGIDMSLFHRYYDEALADLKTRFGNTYPLYIHGEAVTVDGPLMENRSPVDTDIVLGRFQFATTVEVDAAVASARKAWPSWRDTPWQDRVAVMRRAATLIRKQKFEIGAIMGLEVGKNRMEAMGDAEESADLIDYYCQQMDDHHGYVTKMNNITTVETNTDLLRPYGVFACIAPFNFPAALGFGMSSGALLGGNAVVFKPATDTPWTGLKLYEIYTEAGVPPGVFNFVTGRGSVIGDHLVLNDDVDGVVFTGSKQVGMRIFHGVSKNWIKPCLLELGGKNPTIIMPSADLDKAALGVYKSAWGLQNQKCSACSRVYVHADVVDAFTEKLIALSKDVVIGDPTDKDVYMGPVINAAAKATWQKAVDTAREIGEVIFGGEVPTGEAYSKGHFVSPTIVTAALDSTFFRDEFFVPILAIGTIHSLDEALREANAVEYGLTAGIFSQDEAEVQTFFDRIEAGVLYVNKPTGATTGAWPGAQSFCGWKGSGGSGKGGCGPYYVAQFMREQSRCVIRD
jgi:1-pyrroline-5-carboxylate dehydrogenase